MYPNTVVRYQAILQEYVDLLRTFRDQSAALDHKLTVAWGEIRDDRYRIGLVSPDQFQPQDVLEKK